MAFHALLATRAGDGVISTAIRELDDEFLGEGDVTIAVEWSTVNYKDGMALGGRQPVMQRFPLIPGIDLAGTVEASDDPRFAPGDRVVANGWGLSQTHHGGFATRARVKGDWLVKLPAALDTRAAAAIGTAGYTAMMCVLALEHGGIGPDRGNVLVTGASGGVGSVAIAILSKLGYRVVASTGRRDEDAYLRELGAADVIGRLADEAPSDAPLAAPRWAGAVDTAGSRTLVNVLAGTEYRGVVAACGLAQGIDLPGTTLPFILRAVTLCGIDSVNAPQALREQAWQRLASDLDLRKLSMATTEIGLADVPGTARAILQGQVRGRTIVNVNR
jgi:acrylyl-CoA reductase (NADPH)